MLITQTFDKAEYERIQKTMAKETAYKEWQQRLKRGDTLPRGKYFKGKAAGRQILIIDEAWKLLS